MKRIYLILIVLIGITTSCTKNFEDFNTDKKHPAVVPSGALFANAQKAFADQEASTSVNLNEFKQWAQYFTATTYVDETNYNIVSRDVSTTVFRTYYRDILSDLNEAKRLIPTELAQTATAIGERDNKLKIVDMMEVLIYSQLVDIFGNVPYSQSLDYSNLYPKYDDGLTIYKELITRLDADISGLNTDFGSFGTSDLFFGGDVPMWIKFGNSLKVRLGITLADVDGATAKATVESAYAGAFGTGENCQLVYEGGHNANPLYLDLVLSGRHDFVPANTIVDMMNTLDDPRREMYFNINGDTYRGGIYGKSNSFSQFSHISDMVQEATFPCVILDNTEVEFYLAEAAARGYSVGGTAESHYNKAITASFLSWWLTAGKTKVESDSLAAIYLQNPDVAYVTATGTWQQKIGTQAWLAYFVRGQVGFSSWRRLDYPILNMPPTITDYNNIPKRYTYPINEQTLNGANYTAAATAIGGDNLTTKLFWDTH